MIEGDEISDDEMREQRKGKKRRKERASKHAPKTGQYPKDMTDAAMTEVYRKELIEYLGRDDIECTVTRKSIEVDEDTFADQLVFKTKVGDDLESERDYWSDFSRALDNAVELICRRVHFDRPNHGVI